MQIKIKHCLFCLLLITNTIALSQEGNLVLDKRHQLGIGISKFLNNIFPSDNNAFLLEYRYLYKEKNAYRLGGDYRTETSSDGLYEIGVKVGIDRTFRKNNRWFFYYGIDFGGRYLYYIDREQSLTNITLNPFFGIQYHLSENFSISTEPGLFFRYNFSKEERSFSEKNKSWIESRLAKIGVIQVNFHF
ncbi:MAG: hypothetical protein Q3983_03585 [Capnocytophaga sp.]|nr:hypothetical protein [Capnocytophaga sp.]